MRYRQTKCQDVIIERVSYLKRSKMIIINMKIPLPTKSSPKSRVFFSLHYYMHKMCLTPCSFRDYIFAVKKSFRPKSETKAVVAVVAVVVATVFVHMHCENLALRLGPKIGGQN